MKRGESGLSLLVAVNKPQGMSSHDVVNRCRRIFGERRCGHTGTLDPLASGVLPICVGPATRLDKYMVGHGKHYRVMVSFGFETETDDSEGRPTVSGSIPGFLRDEGFAGDFVAKMVGTHEQVPPQYSAIKVAGKKAYEAARKGESVKLEPRHVEIYSASLVEVRDDAGSPSWIVDFHVSKGTYIRALARDMGRNLTCPAHVGALERRRAGRISIQDCMSLETIATLGVQAAIDPVRVLGLRFAFGDDCARFVSAGNALFKDQLQLYNPLPEGFFDSSCACTCGISPSSNAAEDGELVTVIVENRLKAIYRFDASKGRWKPDCIFSVPVYRG